MNTRHFIILLLFFTVCICNVTFAHPGSDSVRIQVLLKQVWELRYSDPQSTWLYLDTAERIAARSENNKLVADVRYYKAIIHYITGDNNNCIIAAEEALRLYRKSDNDYGQTSVYNLLGLTNTHTGDYEKAIGYYHQALAIAEKGDNLYAVSNPYHNIAIIYSETKDYEPALKYALKALEIRQQINDSTFIAESFLTIGGIYYHLLQYEKAEHYLLDAQSYYQTQNNPTGLSLSYNNLGLVYQDMEQWDRAEMLFRKSLELCRKQEGRYEDMVNVLYNLSKLAILKKDFVQSEQYAAEAEQIATTYGLLPSLKEALEALSAALEGRQDYKRAFHTQTRLLAVNDSLLNEEKSRQILNLEIRYQVARKEATITAQSLILSEKDRSLAQRKMWLVAIASVSVLSLIIFYILYNRRHVRAQREEEQKIHSAIFESEQKERIRIARDLHDSIGQKLSVMKMLLPAANGDENIIKISDFLDETAQEVRSISHNLIPEILNFGLIKAFDAIADKINSTGNIHIRFEVPPELRQLPLSKQTELSIYRIVQEILSNIVQHAQADKIRCSIHLLPQHIQISISDNGTGFDTHIIDESRGLGWKNIFARVKLINGTLNIKSEKGKGSDFVLNAPVS